MTYEQQTWNDGTEDYTPLTAERMNHMEEGIAQAHEAWDSVSHTVELTDGVSAVDPDDLPRFIKVGRLFAMQGRIATNLNDAIICTIPESIDLGSGLPLSGNRNFACYGLGTDNVGYVANVYLTPNRQLKLANLNWRSVDLSGVVFLV